VYAVDRGGEEEETKSDITLAYRQDEVPQAMLLIIRR
jgi:hypothetical protein